MLHEDDVEVLAGVAEATHEELAEALQEDLDDLEGLVGEGEAALSALSEAMDEVEDSNEELDADVVPMIEEALETIKLGMAAAEGLEKVDRAVDEAAQRVAEAKKDEDAAGADERDQLLAAAVGALEGMADKPTEAPNA